METKKETLLWAASAHLIYAQGMLNNIHKSRQENGRPKKAHILRQQH